MQVFDLKLYAKKKKAKSFMVNTELFQAIVMLENYQNMLIFFS